MGKRINFTLDFVEKYLKVALNNPKLLEVEEKKSKEVIVEEKPEKLKPGDVKVVDGTVSMD